MDEAYIEFGGTSAVPLLEDHDNLIVLRTFSKWAGIAGLRLGYAVTSPAVAQATGEASAALQRQLGGGRGCAGDL